jgi:hypothetical protein
VVKTRVIATLIASALSFFPAIAASVDAPSHATSLQSRDDGAGTTTYWGDGANYEIVGPGVTVFFLKTGDGGVVAPMIRVAYVGDRWINLRGVTFSVGERIFGPFADVYSKPTRIEAGASLFVEALLFNVDSDEKWGMLEAISESYELGRPVIAVFDGDAPYGIELDRASKRATGQVVRAFRELSVRTH